MNRIRRTGMAVAILAIGLLTACDDDSSGPDEDTVTISVRDNNFQPAERTVDRGTTVRWVNEGNTAHNTRANNNAWQSDNLAPGEDFEVTLQTAGTYDYACTLHEGMTGRIIVQ